MLLRVVLFSGYQGEDDRHFIHYAYLLVTQGTLADDPTQWLGRAGFWLPVAAFVKLFGPTQWAFALYPLLLSTLGLWLAYRIGTRLFDRRTGLLALALVATLPLDVVYATHVFADLPHGVLMVLGFYLAVRAPERRRPLLAYFVSGLVVGIAYLHKELAIYAGLPLAIWLLYTRASWRAILAVLLGGLVVLGAETAFWTAATGDPVFRYDAMRSRRIRWVEGRTARQDRTVPRRFGRPPLESQRTATGGPQVMNGAPQSATGSASPPRLVQPPAGAVPSERVQQTPRPEPFTMPTRISVHTARYLFNQEFGFFYWVAWPAVWWLLWRRERPAAPLLVWMFTMAPLLTNIPLALGLHMSLGLDARFLTPLSIPAAVVAARACLLLPRLARAAVVGAVIAGAAACLFFDGSRDSMANVKAVAARAHGSPGTRFWLEPRLFYDYLAVSSFRPAPNVGMFGAGDSELGRGHATVLSVMPSAAVARETAEMTNSLVIVPADRRWKPAGWLTEHAQFERRLQVGRPGLFRTLRPLLVRAGLPEYRIVRLLPEPLEVWRPRQP